MLETFGSVSYLICKVFKLFSEKNVKFLSSLMIKTGALLAQQIDGAAQKKVKNYKKSHLTNIINQGHQHVGRMLHYFPFS
jgi:hypothetical protein